MSNMYVNFKRLTSEHNRLNHKAQSLKKCLGKIDPKHTFLNLNEDGQWFVEISEENAREIVLNELIETNRKLFDLDVEMLKELNLIVAKNKMIRETIETNETGLNELFGETE